MAGSRIPISPASSRYVTSVVFERFTERARHVVVLAQDEARSLKHNYIGTEHILLGLLREEKGIAARALASLGITIDEVRGQVVRIVGAGADESPGQLPFTPRAKKTLERSLREALSLGHRYIGTEHILLGLLSVEEGVAVRVFEALEAGLELEDVRAQVLQLAAASDEDLAARAAPPAAREIPLSPATERALTRARDEALALKHDAIRPEHVLLGLLGEPGLAARVLGSLEISAENVRAELSALVTPAGAPPVIEAALTTRAKRALDLARREARALQQDAVRPEHVLLGLIREQAGTPAFKRVRGELLHMLSAPDEL
jgi:ATP-dependent Clp protease ATP-binding subunit ClpA